MKTTALWTTVLAVACASPPATQAPPATPAPARAATAEPPQGHHGHHGHSSPTANHRFQDPDRWSKVFDDPERDAWQKPDAVVAALSLNPASVVADLGAGTGYFSIRIARKVPEGKVFAVDIEPKMVAHVEERARHESLTNVAGIVATPNDPKLPAGVDVVLVVDTYHHIEDRTPYFEKVKAKLSPGGRVVIVDFKKGDLPVGPPDAHKIAPTMVQREMKAAGYQQCREWNELPYQYVLFFGRTCDPS